MATKKAPAKKTATPVAKKSAAVPAKKTTAELVRFVAEKLEWSSKQSAAIFDLLAATALQETKKNGEFTIPGLGKLFQAQRAARIGRNPPNGEVNKNKKKKTRKSR